MVLVVLVSSLGFLSDFELLGGMVLRRAGFVSYFCFEDLGPFLKFYLKECDVSVKRCLRDGRLHPSWLGRNFVTRLNSTGFIDFPKSH